MRFLDDFHLRRFNNVQESEEDVGIKKNKIIKIRRKSRCMERN